MSYETLVKKMSNKDLLNHVNSYRKQESDPARYGKGGTSRYVTTKEFWGRSGIKALKQEVAIRKKAGQLKKTAGISRQTKSDLFGLSKGYRFPKFRF
jgi:hypothetical protein